MTNRSMSEIIQRRRPVTLPPDATVQRACQVMRDQRVGAILVTDEDERLIGIFTGRDAVCRMLAEGRDAATTPLGAVMTANPDTIAPERHAIDALQSMQDGGSRHIPVVQGERVLGIASRGDFRGLEHARLDEYTGFWELL